MSRTHTGCGLLAASFLLVGLGTPGLHGQQGSFLVKEGDAVPGAGTVVQEQGYVPGHFQTTVSNSGAWTARLNTDASLPSSHTIAWNGATVVQSGDPVSAPPGASVDHVGSIARNAQGDVAHIHWLHGTASPPKDDQGLYWNGQIVLQKGDPVQASGLPAGMTYAEFNAIRIDDQNRILLSADLRDTDPQAKSYLLRIDVDGQGVPQSETMLYGHGDAVQGMTVVGVAQTKGAMDFNQQGDVIYRASLDPGGGAPSVNAVLMNGNAIAIENTPSPVTGRNWQHFHTAVSVSEGGDYAFAATLDGELATAHLIYKNGAVFVRAGDSLPGIGSHSLSSVSSVEMDDHGRMVWRGKWNDPDTTRDSGLFLDDLLIFQENVTHVDGVPLDEVTERDLRISPNGRYIVFRGELANNDFAYCRIDLGPPGFWLYSPDPGFAQQKNFLVVKEATAFGQVRFFGSFTAGSTPFQCNGPMSLSIAKPKDLGIVQADGVGGASTTRFVPKKLSGLNVWMQALDINACQVSNLVQHAFQ